MFISNVSEWISDGEPTELVSMHLQDLNNNGWLPTLPENGWVLIGESGVFGVCAFYDDGAFPDKTIYQIQEGQKFSDFGIPQSYNCWIRSDPYVYEAFTRKAYQDTQVGSSLLFLSKCYVSNQGGNLVAPSLMSKDANLLYKNVCDLYGEPYKMDEYHIVPMPVKLFSPWGGKFVK